MGDLHNSSTAYSAKPAEVKTGPSGADKQEFGLADLRDSIEKRFVVVEYQPKVPLDAADENFSVEALVRLRHPRFGVVPPDAFIGLAEQHNLILELTDLVTCQALSDWRKWFEHGLTLRLALNVSPELLDDNRWAEQFLLRCREFTVGLEYIILEITESSSKSASESALDILTRLKLKGTTLSIDDFGTGFSSLATLYRLPFDELKIDKCFTLELDRNPAARALVESTVEMAQRLALKVTAEGVETEGVFEQLRLMGCHQAQGYFISKSLAAHRVPAFFAGWRRLRQNGSRGPGLVSKISVIQALLGRIMTAGADGRTIVISSANNTDISEMVATIPPLVLQGRQLPALSACHRATRSLKSSPEHAAVKAQLLDLQRLLESELLVDCDLRLRSNSRDFWLLPRRSVLIGRSSVEMAVDVAIDCRWLSRGDRGLFLRRSAHEWLIEDLGSTNGLSIGGEPLVPEAPVPLQPGLTLVEVGHGNEKSAPLSFCMSRSGGPDGPVVLRVLAKDRREHEAWPTRERDLQTTWIVSRGKITVGSEEDCDIRMLEWNAGILADIQFQGGFWIAPRNGATLFLNDVQFDQPVPLPGQSKLTIGDIEFSVQQITRGQTRADIRAEESTNRRSVRG